MKKTGLLLSLAIVASAACGEKVHWEFPREGGCHEGLAFADGRTGVLVWGGGDTVRLTIGRGDFWDHRGGYPWFEAQNYTNIIAAIEADDKQRLLDIFKKDTPEGEPRNPMLLPLGRVTLTFPDACLKTGELDPLTGLGELVFAKNGTELKAKLAMSTTSHRFAIRLDNGLECTAKATSSLETPRVKKELEPLHHGGIRRLETADGKSGGFCWPLVNPEDAPVTLSWRFDDGGRTFSLATFRGEMPNGASSPVDFDAISDESVSRWKRFWNEGARVRIPDSRLQQAFDYGMYRFGAMTEPDGIPAGLQGAWLEDDKLIPWNGDYHFNINVQECYSPAFRGGHLAHLRPLFRMMLAWREKLRENARRFVGIDDGYVLPHSVDDRGTCIGGFWCGTIDHASTAWMASYMFRYVRYSGDVQFLRDGAYDFMKGAMNVYLAMFEDRDGKLSLPLGPSPEWGMRDIIRTNVGRNPSFQLAAAHRLALDLVEAEKLLGVRPDPRWQDVIDRLPKYSSSRDGAEIVKGLPIRTVGIELFEGTGLFDSHRHHSHMAGFYPFDIIDMKRDRAIVDWTYDTFTMRGCGNWSGWSFPWASILHTHVGDASAAVWMLETWERFFCNPGHGSRHDIYNPGISTMRRGKHYGKYGIAGDAPGCEIMQMDGQCAFVTAVLELMAHDVNGKTEYFRGCPPEWRTVSFENMAFADGRRVSGRRENGVVTVWTNSLGGVKTMGDCYARWNRRELTVGNALFARTYAVTGGVLRTSSFKAAGGVEWQKARLSDAEPSINVTASEAKWSPVGAKGIRLEVTVDGKLTRLDLYPGVPGVIVTRPGVTEFEPMPDVAREFVRRCKWCEPTHAKVQSQTDSIEFAPRHVKATALTALDQTDLTNRLLDEREWLLMNYDALFPVSATALDCRDKLTEDGILFVRLAPMPACRIGLKEDFLLNGESVQLLANGYPLVELAYRGGDAGRQRALVAFQRALRPYRHGRDGVLLSNTWGGGNRDSRINQDFLLKEIEAGAKIGVDVIQIDDGWQRGRSQNSEKKAIAGQKKVWTGYWKTSPDFWKEDLERFPDGIGFLTRKAAEKGMRFGLWFGPDSLNEAENWELDANCLLDYHRRYGIDYFKMDSMKLFTPLAFKRNRMMFDKMLTESDGAMVFDLDCTAEVRPGFFGLMDIGPLFVENRYTKRPVYWPHQTLKNLWELSHLIDPVRLRMEFNNPDTNHEVYRGSPLSHANYRPDALFATVMAASPLAWMELSDVSEKSIAALAPLVATWKAERKRWHGGVIHPVGMTPDGTSWTGFVSEAADGQGGYVLLFRELNASPKFSLSLVDFPGMAKKRPTVIAGRGTASCANGELSVEIPEKLDYLWLKF